MYKIFIKSLLFFTIMPQLMFSAEVTETLTFHELCSQQDKHPRALQLLQEGRYADTINVPNQNGQTPLFLIAPFVLTPNTSTPDPYGQGDQVVSARSQSARELAQLLIVLGAKNNSDSKGADCISRAGTAWFPYKSCSTPLENIAQQECLSTREWLKEQFEMPKNTHQALSSITWHQSPYEITTLITTFLFN